MSFDSAEFRRALGKFATGVTVVTATSDDGELAGVTINAFSSVSLHPPLVLFCLADTSASLPLFAVARRFAINILAEDQIECAKHYGGIGEVSLSSHGTSAGESGCPMLDGSLVSLECRSVAVHDGGDHKIIVAEVINIVEGTAEKPLLYCGGKFAKLP